MTEYEYTIYAEDGTVTTHKRSTQFSLCEMRDIVGGRIEQLPVKIPGKKGFDDVYVVCEDGMYKFKKNIRLPQFYGNVLVANKHLV